MGDAGCASSTARGAVLELVLQREAGAGARKAGFAADFNQ